MLKEILNSPGYFISSCGDVYNKDNRKLKGHYSEDGYKRIRLPSLIHDERQVNRTVHLLVGEVFKGIGKYAGGALQLNHIDGDKKNNCSSNLEEMTGTENVNHAHDNQLYTHDIVVTVNDVENNITTQYRSLRETAVKFGVSLNYLKPRIRISEKYLFLGKYRLSIDFKKYYHYDAKCKNGKNIYVYNHYTDKQHILSSYSQIAILLGLSSITINKQLLINPDGTYYSGGFTFSLNYIENIKFIDSSTAIADRNAVWKKLSMGINDVELK